MLDAFLEELAKQHGTGNWRAQMVEGMTEEKMAETLKATEAALLVALDRTAADNLVCRTAMRELVTLHTWEREAKEHGHPVPPEVDERMPGAWKRAEDIVTGSGD
jgi:hypothetical protein